MTKYFWLSLFTFAYLGVFGQSYTFTPYSIAEGLAQSQVTSIAEDQNGYLWVGTLGGLSRFNGSSFSNFSAQEGLLNNRVTALYPDGDRLWVGHENGISLYYKRQFKHWSLPNKTRSASISTMLTFKGRLLVATNGGGLYVFKDNHLEAFSGFDGDKGRIRDALVLDDKLYLATRAGLFISSDLKSFQRFPSDSSLNLTKVVKRRKKTLILSTTDGLLLNYNTQTQLLDTLYATENFEFIYDCFVDEKQQIWFTSDGGLSLLDKDNNFERINEQKGLPLNNLSSIYEDVNHTIWVGSQGKGLFRFSGKQLTYYNKKHGFASDLVTAVIELAPKHYCFGTYDSRLIFSSNGKFTVHQLENSTIWALAVDEENMLWVATSNELYRTKDGKIVDSHQIDEKASCFFKDNRGGLYCGGSFGILQIKNGKTRVLSSQEDLGQVGTVRQIVEFNGQLLCAADGGVFAFKQGKFRRFLNIRSSANSIHVDQQKNLWIGTENGLFWSNGDSLKRMFLSSQPASNLINFINSKNQLLLVGTNNGLYMLSELQLKDAAIVRYFGKEEGLINLETNSNSSYVDQQGNFWFGTAEGLMHLKLTASEPLHHEGTPFLQISALKLNFQSFDYSKYSTRFSTDGIPLNLTLPPNKNNIIVELDGITLRHHKNLRYEYWLEGLDSYWSPAFTSPFVTLSNLPSGNYTLHVRAKNGLGKTSQTYSLDIEIKPHFYKTWWFFTLNALFLALSIYGFIKFRINREREKQYKETLEYKSKLLSLEQQSLNASMNRHFIFNSLNSIQYFINTQDRHSANKYLTNFAKLIRKNLDSSSENNNFVSLQQEVERLELYLSLESMRFKDRFEYQIDTDDIDLESIHVPSMLFQPFIENSIIHGILPLTEQKGRIRIEMSIKNKVLNVLIEDNGVGIENSLAKKQHFNGDHQSKGMEITSKRISLLKKLSHLEYELEGPYQIEDSDRLINGTRVLIKIPLENLEDS